MYFLKDLPTHEDLKKIASQYKELNPSAIMACIVLLRTGSDVLAAFEKKLNSFDITQGGYLTLIVLMRNAGREISASELAGKVGVTRATMTGIIDTLAKRNLIERIPHRVDRRSMTVKLTKKGNNLLNKILPIIFGHATKLMSQISKSEHEILISLLTKVGSGLAQIGK